ncbi:uncharacterized protein BJ171DRAFT_473161 [Polychytrium aggregatum]|uniref:uncharacterized protein n=1 Tax=Polychytrium aggregatum TaxID=110093 RepID=UPI0022FEE5EF|nr:uncharacterized protein BJ171DRAFT_473161 [Polychytrium aggregatum]KAI9206640.1 hypothetical protein BJ171DRAFT_473161 [Polychytrium aggregatum]
MQGMVDPRFGSGAINMLDPKMMALQSHFQGVPQMPLANTSGMVMGSAGSIPSISYATPDDGHLGFQLQGQAGSSGSSGGVGQVINPAMAVRPDIRLIHSMQAPGAAADPRQLGQLAYNWMPHQGADLQGNAMLASQQQRLAQGMMSTYQSSMLGRNPSLAQYHTQTTGAAIGGDFAKAANGLMDQQQTASAALGSLPQSPMVSGLNPGLDSLKQAEQASSLQRFAHPQQAIDAQNQKALVQQQYVGHAQQLTEQQLQMMHVRGINPAAVKYASADAGSSAQTGVLTPGTDGMVRVASIHGPPRPPEDAATLAQPWIALYQPSPSAIKAHKQLTESLLAEKRQLAEQGLRQFERLTHIAEQLNNTMRVGLPGNRKLQPIFKLILDSPLDRRLKRERFAPVSDEIAETVSQLEEELVPIRIDFEDSGIKVRDTFTWNLNESCITPEQFAKVFCDDMHLPKNFAPPIAKSIRDQIEDSRSFRSIAIARPVVNVVKLERPPDEALGTSNNSNDSASSHVDKKIKVEPDWDEGHAAPQPDTPEAVVCDHPELRIVIKVDVIVGSTSLVDQFEWDINCTRASPEDFAAQLTAEHRLDPEFTTAIAHSIREQVEAYKKALLLLNHPFDDSPIDDEELATQFLPSIHSVQREQRQMDAFTSYLFNLENADMERQERAMDRDVRRKRRQTQRSRTLPDREPLKTNRTPLPLPGSGPVQASSIYVVPGEEVDPSLERSSSSNLSLAAVSSSPSSANRRSSRFARLEHSRSNSSEPTRRGTARLPAASE